MLYEIYKRSFSARKFGYYFFRVKFLTIQNMMLRNVSFTFALTIQLISVSTSAAVALLFYQKTDGRCLNSSIAQPLKTLSLVNRRQCAIACSITNRCGAYSVDTGKQVCVLHERMSDSEYSVKAQSSQTTTCITGLVRKMNNANFYISRVLELSSSFSLLK